MSASLPVTEATLALATAEELRWMVLTMAKWSILDGQHPHYHRLRADVEEAFAHVVALNDPDGVRARAIAVAGVISCLTLNVSSHSSAPASTDSSPTTGS